MLYSYNKFIIVISDYLLEVDIQRITTLNCTNVVTSFWTLKEAYGKFLGVRLDFSYMKN